MSVGERIKQARLMADLSLARVAERAGVSAQAVSKYERGLDMPGSRVLLRLAQALGVPIEYFLRPAAVASITPVYRKCAALAGRREAAVLARITEWLERYVDAESLIEPAGPAFRLPDGFPWPVAAVEEVELAAAALREAWQLGLDPIENVVQVLEDRGIKVGLLDDAPAGFDACTFSAEVDGGVPVIVVAANVPGDRQRFSLAHELGHVVLRPGPGVDAERAAMRFAGAWLVPAATARFELGDRRHTLSLPELASLKHKYGLSMQGWVYRAADLGILSRTDAERLFRAFGRHGWRRQEPGRSIAPERPERLERLVFRALAEGVIGEARASELLGLRLHDLLNRLAEERGVPPITVCR